VPLPSPPDALLDRTTYEAAQRRIHGLVRKTPLARLRAGEPSREGADARRGILEIPVGAARLPQDLFLKLESLQVTGSFKARGAVNRVLGLGEAAGPGIVTASGGNHGLAVAYAGRAVGVEATVYLPSHTPAAKAAQIERWGARVLRAGSDWDDAHEAATAHARRHGLAYVHPFADVDVVAGQGTIALEVLAEAPEIDLLMVAIGGGGLIAGVAAAAKLVSPGVRVIGVEPEGAPTLRESVRAGAVIELEAIHTRAGTLAPRRSDALNFALVARFVDELVLVSDDEMRDAARFLLSEAGLGAELSGAAALAAVLNGKIDLRRAKHPCVLVCGAGSDAVPKAA
jgi:threonine dehydratase